MDSIGDLARQLVLSSHYSKLKGSMDDLAIQLATGLTHDAAMHLNGETSTLLAINRSITKISAYEINIVEADLIASTMQTSLEVVQSSSQNAADVMLNAELTPEESLLTLTASSAENSLTTIMSELNRAVAGRFVFAGTKVDSAAVYSVNDLLDDVISAVSGLSEVAEIEDAIDTFFEEGGAYDTDAYLGSSNYLSSISVNENESIEIEYNAKEDGIKEILKPLVAASIATNDLLDLNVHVQMDLLTNSGENLFDAQTSITELRADVGMVQSRIEDASVKNEAEKYTANLAKLGLTAIDAYEASVAYESITVQLESLYAITARSSRLSLVEYL